MRILLKWIFLWYWTEHNRHKYPVSYYSNLQLMAGNANHCSFVLLAEFHILEGAQLKYQFPQPLGVDER